MIPIQISNTLKALAVSYTHLDVYKRQRLTDGQGRTVDFKNTVIVMTSNLGSQRIQQMTDDGSDQALIKMSVLAEVKTSFRPEFVNRIDEILSLIHI